MKPLIERSDWSETLKYGITVFITTYFDLVCHGVQIHDKSISSTALRPDSQYSAGAISFTSVLSIMEKSIFHQSNSIPDV